MTNSGRVSGDLVGRSPHPPTACAGRRVRGSDADLKRAFQHNPASHFFKLLHHSVSSSSPAVSTRLDESGGI